MLARLSAFVIWAVVAATVVFWGLRLLVHAPAAPDRTIVVADAGVARADLSRLLGTPPAVTSAGAPVADPNSRFKLLGIVAPEDEPGVVASATHGVALIAVDGKMPKAYIVGASVDGDLTLQSVSLRTASIGSGQGGVAPIMLELPPPVAATIGKLPPGGATTSQVPFVPPPVAPQVAPVMVPQPMSPQGVPPQVQSLTGVQPPGVQQPQPGVVVPPPNQ